MGRITSTKPSLTSADIQAAVTAALAAHSFESPLTETEIQEAAAAALNAHGFDTPLTAAEAQAAAEAALGAAPPSPIASIQRGVITLGTDSSSRAATITEVELSKAMVVSASTTLRASYLRLTSSTELTLKRTTSSSGSFTVPYEVIEYA